ncbi:MAG TPA: ATP-dependent RNA helicase [Microscillaceae bacterium]|nr:ATP-dependent RNA helicase [Microscillaceae bacterium]
MQQLFFKDLTLSAPLLKAIEDLGYVQPSPIQAAAIPVALTGVDLIGQAQTGTGKTASFALPLLEKIDITQKNVQAIILCPTRELAVQVCDEIKKLAKYLPECYILPIYGGASIDNQIRFLRKGVQIVVGTPGRVIDHLERRTLSLSHVNTVVLDEADEMLNMGFRDDIESILQTVPKSRQTLFFSATMPQPILELTQKYQNQPKLIKIVPKELTSVNVEQQYFQVKPDAKVELLARLIEAHDIELGIVFCNTKQGVDDLVMALNRLRIPAEGLHGDMSQAVRNQVMGKFKSKILKLLVATDVAARGIDVDNVEAVFNFDVPFDPEYYVHRIGRTGRAGKKGRSFTFLGGRKESFRLKDIERYAKITIEKGVIPSVVDLHQMRQAKFLDQLRDLIAQNNIDSYLPVMEQLEAEGFTAEQVAAALLKMAGFPLKPPATTYSDIQDTSGENHSRREFDGKGKSSSYGRGARDDKQSPKKWEKKARISKSPMTKLFVNAGAKQKISKTDVLGVIAQQGGITGKNVGLIEIHDHYALVDVPTNEANIVLEKLSRCHIKGKKVNFRLASNKFVD